MPSFVMIEQYKKTNTKQNTRKNERAPLVVLVNHPTTTDTARRMSRNRAAPSPIPTAEKGGEAHQHAARIVAQLVAGVLPRDAEALAR